MTERKPFYIQYEGLNLLYLDFKEIQNEEIPDFISICKAFVAKCEHESVLFLVNVHGMHYNMKTIRDFTNFSRYNSDFSKATAVVGMTKEMQVLYNVALSMAGRDKRYIKTFDSDDEEAAKAWLKNVIDEEKGEKEKLLKEE